MKLESLLSHEAINICPMHTYKYTRYPYESNENGRKSGQGGMKEPECIREEKRYERVATFSPKSHTHTNATNKSLELCRGI